MLSAHIICFSEEGSCILIGVKLKLNVLMAPLFHASLSIFRASNHRRWFPCIDWPQGKLVKLQAQCGQILFEIEVKTGDFNSGQKLKIQNFAINNEFFFRVWNFWKIGDPAFCKRQGEKNRLIVIQKENSPGCLFSFWITTTLDFCTLFFLKKPGARFFFRVTNQPWFSKQE